MTNSDEIVCRLEGGPHDGATINMPSMALEFTIPGQQALPTTKYDFASIDPNTGDHIYVFNGDKTPLVVALIGSSLFREVYIEALLKECMKGNIPVGLTPIKSKDFPSSRPISEEESDHIQEWKKQTIIIANEVLVLDVGEYIGEHTKDLIGFATALDKKIRYWSLEEN